MDVHKMCDADEAFRLCCDLPCWINLHRQRDERRRYQAKELDYSFNGLPTLTVGVSDAQARIAVYKCNIALIADKERPWLVFSPLVVVWEKSKEERGPGPGRPIIDHSVSAITGFCEAYAHDIPNVLIASGNLTIAKAGRPFFEALVACTIKIELLRLLANTDSCPAGNNRHKGRQWPTKNSSSS